MNLINNIANLVTPYASQIVDFVSLHPISTYGGVAAGAITLLGLYLATRKPANPDIRTVTDLTRKIIEQEPTIADGSDYPFVESQGRYVDEGKSKDAALAMMAAFMRTMPDPGEGKKPVKYSDDPKNIVKLGRDALLKNSGQCDHMAAAVISKIVDHIKAGGRWNSSVELMGNGGHAFVVIGRNRSLPTSDMHSWKDAVVVDAWLGCLKPKADLQRIIQMKDGIVQKAESFAREFGGTEGDIRVSHHFSAVELKNLAKADF